MRASSVRHAGAVPNRLTTPTRQNQEAPGLGDKGAAVLAACALVVFACTPSLEFGVPVLESAIEHSGEDQHELALARRREIADQVRYRGGETLVAAYGGSPYTYASDVRIVRPAGTDLTAHAIDWEGRPFESPIYYGARVARWLGASSLGGMLDFTHSKVYSPMEQSTRFSGHKDGVPLPAQSVLGDQFHKLEFTHGHNMLTLNLLWRVPFRSAFVSPYIGIGFGASLPHTEVQLKGEGTRTYEYQLTGPAIQALIGIEFRVPRMSYFAEYKFSWADYRAPLHNRDGGWVISDLLYQFRHWRSGKEPEGGWATTRLTSHQVISGAGIRSGGLAAAP